MAATSPPNISQLPPPLPNPSQLHSFTHPRWFPFLYPSHSFTFLCPSHSFTFLYPSHSSPFFYLSHSSPFFYPSHSSVTPYSPFFSLPLPHSPLGTPSHATHHHSPLLPPHHILFLVFPRPLSPILFFFTLFLFIPKHNPTPSAHTFPTTRNH